MKDIIYGIATNAIVSLCNEDYKDHYELFNFGIDNPTEMERELIDCIKKHFSDFLTVNKTLVEEFKNKENNYNNIGLLWLSFCDDKNVFEELESIKRRPRILSI